MSEDVGVDFSLPDLAFNTLVPIEHSEYWCSGLGTFVRYNGFFRVENNVVHYSFTCSKYVEETDSMHTFGVWLPQGGFSL